MRILDQKIFDFLHSFAGVSREWYFLITFFASNLAYVIIALAAIIPFIAYRRRFSASYNLSAVLTAFLSASAARFVITPIIRFIWPIERPFVSMGFPPLFPHEVSASFPSGHAVFFFALAVSLSFHYRKLGIALLALSLLMGIARVAAGVHWPSDIVAGAFIGVIIALFAEKARKKFL